MSLNDIRACIETNLQTAFVPAKVGAIAFENVNFDPPSGETWLQVFYSYGDGFNQLIGTYSQRKTVFNITININSNQAKGSGQALTIASDVLKFYETLPQYFKASTNPLPQIISLTPRGPRPIVRSGSSTRQPSNYYTLETSVNLVLLLCSPTLTII